jgi:hypothetical protein
MKLEIDFEKQNKRKKRHTTKLAVCMRTGGGAATQVLKMAHDIDLTVPREGPGKAQGFPSFFFSSRCVKKFGHQITSSTRRQS